MATISVFDSAGLPQTVAKVTGTGSDVDANALPVAFSTEGKAQLGSLTEAAPASDTASSGLNGRMQRLAQRITALIALFPAALGATTKALSFGVALASDDNLVTMVTAPASGVQSSVASSASDVTVLASNSARKGAYIYNDSTQVLYLLVGSGTSSTTVFTQKMAAGDAFALQPGSYTGVVKGIWASANGFARVTEWS